MKTVVIIQARLNSARLKSKVLMDIAGKPMLWHVYRRASRIEAVDQVVVATSFSEADQAIVQWCQLHSIPVMRGGNANENDVLSRYWDVATQLSADVIMRVTGDCPCLDPVVSGEVLELWQRTGAEFATNRGQQAYPDGYDTEVFGYGLLSAAYWHAKEESEREHVTPWMQVRAKPCFELTYDGPYARLKLSVDTEEDLARVRALYVGIGRDDFGLEDVIRWHETQLVAYHQEHKDSGEDEVVESEQEGG